MPEVRTDADVVILGSGGAGLTAAAVAAAHGARVVIVEASSKLGGTSAVSGGMVWVPNNRYMAELGVSDSREEALEYLMACTAGRVSDALCAAYVDGAPLMVDALERWTPARFRAVMRPDYRPEWPGGKPGGRTLDNLPFDTSPLAGEPLRPRRNPLPLTHDEMVAAKLSRTSDTVDWEEVRERQATGVVTMGAALTASLAAGCVRHNVEMRTCRRATELLTGADGRVTGVRVETGDGNHEDLRAARGVVVATGGFEWSTSLRAAYISRPLDVPVSPPWNVGDGLRLGQRLGAAVGNMTEAWWVPTILIPGETYDGERLGRHLGSELSLPGSILVNTRGRRFVNESVNYNDLSAAFDVRDCATARHANLPCWIVFDSAYRSRYSVATVGPSDPPASWWHQGRSIEELARASGIDAAGLASTLVRFNEAARHGVDTDFGRGESAHDRFYGDSAVQPNPCLAPIEQPPFFAIEVHPGAFGTKGGLAIDEHARVVDDDGRPIPGLFAAGNASAGMTGPGYPGAGATLGSALTFGYLAAMACTSAG